MSKPVWHNEIERDAFMESNCDRCYQPDQAMHRIDAMRPRCPHLERAEQNKMPSAWTRRRNAVMGETYRCADRLVKPPVNRRGKAPADTLPMFEPDMMEIDFVPVEGWPTATDFGKSKKTTGDHA